MDRIYMSHNTLQTQVLAEEIAMQLQGGEVLTLFGDLGAGKTTFTQGLAKALGVARNVNSPTFIIHRSYDVTHPTITQLHHIDLYRIEGDSDLEMLGLDEIFNQKTAIVVIEWPEKMGSRLSKIRTDVKFEYVSKNERRITIENPKSEYRNAKQ